MKPIAAIFLIVSIGVLSIQAQDYGTIDARAHAVSLVQLIVRPEKYSGMSVRVRGALHWGHEGSYLFLTRDHLEVWDTTSAIEIGKSKKDGAPTKEQLQECSDALVVVEGLVHKEVSEDGCYLEITRVLVSDSRRSKEKQKESDQHTKPTAPSGRDSP